LAGKFEYSNKQRPLTYFVSPEWRTTLDYSARRGFSVFSYHLLILPFLIVSGGIATASWQQGFDFRYTAGFVSDPAGNAYVLSTTAYPTKGNGVTYGWLKTSLVQGSDRNKNLDPRLAGINFVSNGAPATFYVDLPSPGTYNLWLAMGDASYTQCWTQCEIQFLDGNTVLATLAKGKTLAGYLYDALGNNWSAAQWPNNNVSQQVTLTGTRLTVIVGLGSSNGDVTPIAFLGIAQVSSGPSFTISASPAAVSVPQGNPGTSTITTAVSGGFNSSIALSATGVPSGTTVTFNPNPIPAPGAGTSTMTITVGSGTPIGTYPITVTGNGGGVQQTITVALTVTAQQQPNFTLSALPASLSVVQGNQGTSTISSVISGGFNSAITLSASGMPSGTTVSFNPNPIPSPGSGNSTMTITVGSNTPTGTYPVTVTGNGGGIQQTTTVTLTVTPPPGFTISASPAAINVQQGNQGTSTITTTGMNGFNGVITLSASGMPSGTTVSFNPNPIPSPGSGNSTMTITVGSNTPTGTYPIMITGNGSGVQQTATVTLTVTAPPTFTISASPGSVTIQQGYQATSAIMTIGSNGFNSAVMLSSSGTPTGTTVSFSPNPIPAPGSGSSTMTITVGSGTATGTYPITVTGNGGGVQQTATVTLTVTAASGWQAGFDFRNSANFVTDPPGDRYVLSATPYPTTMNGATFGWTKPSLVQARDRSTTVDPRLAGINFATNGSPATFYVDLPSPGTYSMSLAMGDATYLQCSTQCQVQFLDGNTLLATVTGGQISGGYFYDAQQNRWSTAAWPANNLSQLLTLAGTRLTMTVGLNRSNGDVTTVAFLGLTQAFNMPNFEMLASPSTVSIGQGNQGTSTISTSLSGGFNSGIALSVSGAPAGTTVSLNPQTLPAPGGGSSTMTINVGANAPTGTYPITVTGTGGGVRQTTIVTLTVTAFATFTISATPPSLSIADGNQGASTISTVIKGVFNSAIGLSASGLPSGATVSFNPPTIPPPGSGTSRMAVTVGSGTPVGTYPITVSGNGGGVQQTATVTLTVSTAIPPGPPTAYYMQPYTYALQSAFGSAPYTYQLSSGSLPSGLTMDPSGNITGTPTSPGQFPFEVLASDSSSPPQQQVFDYTLSVRIGVTTYHNDNYRSGANLNESILTTSNVSTQSFGKLQVFPVQGYVYAQPLYVPGVSVSGVLHDVVYIATEHDQVYAYDADNGQLLWQTNLLASTGNLVISTVSTSDVYCSDLSPEIGITGTPVIDTMTGTLYLVAKTKVYNTQTQQTSFYQTLHALDITTGLDRVTPQQIIATFPGNGGGSSGGMLTFDPLRQAQRPALLLANGQVFIAWASHCDLYFHGYMMAYDKATLAQSGVFVSTPNGEDGGFWASGAGPALDSSGSIYLPSGNGDFSANVGGIDYGDSIIRLNWSSTGQSFTVADYFTPWDQQSMDQNDGDLGSGGVMLLPDQPGATYPHLLVQAGKKGDIYLINRDNMGQWNPSGNDNQIVQNLPGAIGGEFGSPAFWNNNIYFGGTQDNLKAFAFNPQSQQISTPFTSRSQQGFRYPPPTPAVSSSGNTNAIVWVVQDDAYGKQGSAILRAYDATNLGQELYDSTQNAGRDTAGVAAKFTVPTIADGLVFVGALNEVDMYGLLPH